MIWLRRRTLNRILLSAFPESSIFRIDHYLAKGPVHNMVVVSFFELVSGAVVEPSVHRECADYDGGGLRHTGAWGLL